MDAKNLVDIASTADAADWQTGREWYPTAYAHCQRLSEMSGHSVQVCAGVLSLLSAGCSWERNLAMAETMLATGDCNHPYGRQTAEARRLLSGEAWEDIKGHGPKIDAFRLAILGDVESVVVDRHAYSAALGRVTTEKERKVLGRKTGYETCAKLYVEAARQLGTPARDLQATVWVVWRRQFGKGVG